MRCPACGEGLGALAPVPGTRLTTRCPSRRCRVWVVVIVPLDTEPTPA